MTENEIVKKLQAHPGLKTRFEQIISIVENTRGNATLADDAEQQVIVEMRSLGHEVLQEWAEGQSKKVTDRVIEQKPSLRKHVKKNSNGIRHMEK